MNEMQEEELDEARDEVSRAPETNRIHQTNPLASGEESGAVMSIGKF